MLVVMQTTCGGGGNVDDGRDDDDNDDDDEDDDDGGGGGGGGHERLPPLVPGQTGERVSVGPLNPTGLFFRKSGWENGDIILIFSTVVLLLLLLVVVVVLLVVLVLVVVLPFVIAGTDVTELDTAGTVDTGPAICINPTVLALASKISWSCGSE